MDLRRAPGCWGEVRGAHLLSGAEARSSSHVEKKKKNSTARARGHKRANTKTKYKVDTQSMLFFGLRNDCAEDVHRADANRLGEKRKSTKADEKNKKLREKKKVRIVLREGK